MYALASPAGVIGVGNCKFFEKGCFQTLHLASILLYLVIIAQKMKNTMRNEVKNVAIERLVRTLRLQSNGLESQRSRRWSVGPCRDSRD